MKEERNARKRELWHAREDERLEEQEQIRQNEAKIEAKRVARHTAGKPDGRKSLPSWYHRVTALRAKRAKRGYGLDSTPGSWDYEGDLSDLGEPGNRKGCDCSYDEEYDSDWNECGCETDRSYDSSDADLYYEMKRERENFKKDMKETQAEAADLQKDVLAAQAKIVTEVKAAYAAVRSASAQKEAEARPTLKMKRQETFYLYSIDYATHCFDAERWGSMLLQFHHPADFDDPTKYDTFGTIDSAAVAARAKSSSRLRTGDVYFNSRDGGGFADFKLPKRAGRKKHVVKSDNGKHRCTLQFINNHYVIMTVPQKFAAGKMPVSASAPDKFKFYGIRGDIEMKSRRGRF